MKGLGIRYSVFGIRYSVSGIRNRTEHRIPETGFTLVEIVITLTIMALLLGAAVPAIQGVIREKQALEPLTELAEMVRTARERAIRLQRPYQIGLDAEGCFASGFFPDYQGSITYQDLKNEVDAMRQEIEVAEASAARFGGEASPEPAEPQAPGAPPPLPPEPDDRDFLLRYPWPEGYQVSVRFWQDPQWETLEGALSRLWVIQPSGLSLPVLVRIEADGVTAEGRFDPLTGELVDLHSSVR